MKKTILFFFSICCLALINCERDDICAENTPTTPLLYIQFYNKNIPENKKNVSKFRAQGVDNEQVLTDYNVVLTNKVFLPLKTNTNQTQYKLHRGYEVNDNGTPNDTADDYIEGNEDIITIAYATKEVYVSRACGYKTIFENVTITVEDDGDNWIAYVLPTTDNQSITNEDEAHFHFFH